MSYTEKERHNTHWRDLKNEGEIKSLATVCKISRIFLIEHLREKHNYFRLKAGSRYKEILKRIGSVSMYAFFLYFFF